MSPRGHQKKGSNSFWRSLWSQEGCSPLPASTAWNRRDFLCQLCPEKPGGSGGECTRRAAAWGQTGPPQEREHPRRSRFVLTLLNVKNSVFLTYFSSPGAPLPSTSCPKKFSRHFFSNCSPNTPCIYILYVYLCFIPKTSKIFPPSELIFALPITTYDVERESLGESFPSPRSSNYT